MPPRRLSAYEKRRCRAKRIQQKLCHAFFKEFVFYCSYIVVICVTCYAVQDPNSYLLASNLRDLCTKPRVQGGLQFEKVQSHPHWTRGAKKWSHLLFLMLHALLGACSVDSTVAAMGFLGLSLLRITSSVDGVLGTKHSAGRGVSVSVGTASAFSFSTPFSADVQTKKKLCVFLTWNRQQGLLQE